MVSKVTISGFATGKKHTIDLEKVLVARLGGELLGVDNGLLEGIALRGRHFGWVSIWKK